MRIHVRFFALSVLIFNISLWSCDSLFPAIFSMKASPDRLSQLNSLIEAFITGQLQIKQSNNEKNISFQNCSQLTDSHSMRFDIAKSVLILINNRIEGMKALNMGRPSFIINRSGNISSCSVNMFEIQAFRLNDFIQGKLFISDRQLNDFDNNLSTLTGDEKRQKMNQFEIDAQSIINNRKRYLQAFLQADVESLKKAMQQKVDWEYMPLHQYHAEVNEAFWRNLIPLTTVND